MFFYKFTYLKQNGEIFNDKNFIDEMIKQDMLVYKKFHNEKKDDDIFLFVVKDDIGKLMFDVIFQKSIDTIDMVNKVAEDFIKSFEGSLDFFSKKEISVDTLIDDLQQAEENNFIENINDIKAKYDIKFGLHRHYKEYIISREYSKQDEILDFCDKHILNDQLKEEIKRIYAPRKNNAFGVPVHYILNMRETVGNEAVKVLVDALHSNGRMLRDKYTILRPEHLRYSGIDLFFEILSVLRMNDGGVVVISSNIEIDETDCYSREMEVLETICRTCKVVQNEITLIFQLYSVKNGQLNYIKNYLSDLSFVEVLDTALHDEMAKNFLNNFACKYNIQETQSLFDLIEPNKLYKTFELEDIFKNWHKNYMKTVQFPQYSMFVKEEKIIEKVSTKDSYNELNNLIGLDNIKKIIADFINYSKLQQAYKSENMKIMPFSRHMCFVGNPGTAKTTVARIIAKIMKEENLLSNGKLIEVGRADIVSKFVGGTAPKVQELFKQAIGNVLFIDEAYSLCDGKDGLYGDEAISAIVQEMENNRENMVVIFAGYKDKMQKFLERNAGLRSRIAFEVEFPDYSEEELVKIAEYYAIKMDIDISQCKEKIREIIAFNKDDKNFGNGRFIRNLLEKARMKQATRLVNGNLLHTSKIRELLPEDIDMPIRKVDKFSFGFHS